jgi:hypothetical protein
MFCIFELRAIESIWKILRLNGNKLTGPSPPRQSSLALSSLAHSAVLPSVHVQRVRVAGPTVPTDDTVATGSHHVHRMALSPRELGQAKIFSLLLPHLALPLRLHHTPAITVHRQAAAPQALLGQPPSCATATPLSGTSPQAALCQGKHLKNSNAKPPREPFAWTARTRPPSTPPAPPRPSPEWHAPPRPLR